MRIAMTAAWLAASLAGCIDATPSPGGDIPVALGASPARSALERAHDAYLKGDTLGVTLALKEVLVDEAVDPTVRDNALGLLEKSYELKGGVVPADWSVPKGMQKLTMNQARVEEPDETRFVVSLSGFIDDPARFVGLSLSRGPETYLDQATGRGKLTSHLEAAGSYPSEDTRYYFSFETDWSHPIGPGVYAIHIELRGAAPVDGWVIAGDLTSAGASRIHAPAVQAVVDGNPTLRFDDYISPAFRPFERRTLSIYVSHDGHPSWELWTAEPGFTQVVLGNDARGGPQGKLAPGRHWIALGFGEKRRFGPVDMNRISRAQQPFEVR